MIPMLYTRLHLSVMEFYGISSRDVPVIRAIGHAWEGGNEVSHEEVKEAFATYSNKLPIQLYNGISEFVSHRRRGEIVTLEPIMITLLEAFETTDDHFLVRIGDDTEFLGYTNFTIRRHVEKGILDGFIVNKRPCREHYLAITEEEANRLKEFYLKIYRDPPQMPERKVNPLELGRPNEVLSLLEQEGHGASFLADKVRMYLNMDVLPNHIMYDVKKLL